MVYTIWVYMILMGMEGTGGKDVHGTNEHKGSVQILYYNLYNIDEVVKRRFKSTFWGNCN